MDADRNDYLVRVRTAFAEIEAEERPSASPEEAFRRFFRLMDGMQPLVDAFSRPQRADEGEPEELGFYRHWRRRESARSHA